MLFFLINIPLCSGSCHSGLPNHIIAGKYSTWKLCIVNTYKETLRFKIKSLFSAKDNSTGWLNIGFPQASQKTDYIPFFLLEVSPPNSIVIKQTDSVKEVKCSKPAKRKLKLISVDCDFGETMNKYVNSKRITIFWNTGNGTADVTKEGKKLIKNHSTLYFYPHQDQNVPDANAGSTAMRLLRNYGKSMGAIFGISFLLTALITLTICCCCKKKTTLDFSKQKLSKDSSVSFYRDESEGDGQSDESGDDEKVAFIRNNNERNSSV